MENQLTNNANALRLFFTEDIFLVKDESVQIALVDNEKPVSNPIVSETDLTGEKILQPKSEAILVETNEESAKSYTPQVEIPRVLAEPKSPKTFKFLGGNKKSVLILVNDKLNDVSTPEGRELLRKIVKAVDLGTPDFAVVNYAQYMGTEYVDFHEFFKPAIMLSFGVEISDLKLNLVWQNEIIQHESTKIIFAPNLHQLDSDLTAKKLLWGNLQKIKL
ncbi:hypothetical protein OQZ33_22365 [Pedobacter sp. MC2016-05]|uniref:hypothetical protein n=1 Tax=Pedobacter sp. MC2016-05 TaxID=2994474 RepID=UPI0022468170|nr:hypothetical protein [Pedobacter sp. MC2016-05]MCX2477096.1 hypothetical protein [Pedobacter sp. MC2016-05]